MITLIDAGPLVAVLNKRDPFHQWARAAFARFRSMITCEAAITETCFLIKREGGRAAAPLAVVGSGAVTIDFSLGEQNEAVERIMSRYADIGASLADACLVRLSELHPRSQVMTFDRNFLVYRRNGREKIPLIAPFED